MAMKYVSSDIRINEVRPGFIKTPMLEAVLGLDELKKVIARIPMKKVGDGDDVANVICFLLSDEANYITGASIAVDGGYSCT